MTGQEGTQHLAAVQTDNGVHTLVVGVALSQRHGGLPGHGVFVLHAGDVDVVGIVRVTGGKVACNHGYLYLGVQFGPDIHSVASNSSKSPKSCVHIILFLVRKSKPQSHISPSLHQA